MRTRYVQNNKSYLFCGVIVKKLTAFHVCNEHIQKSLSDQSPSYVIVDFIQSRIKLTPSTALYAFKTFHILLGVFQFCYTVEPRRTAPR